MNISEEIYFEERLDFQINWYDTRSQKSQRIYKMLKGVQIVLSASIPLLVGFIVDYTIMVKVVGFFGIVITAIEGWLGLSKHHENWIEYRSEEHTSELQSRGHLVCR